MFILLEFQLLVREFGRFPPAESFLGDISTTSYSPPIPLLKPGFREESALRCSHTISSLAYKPFRSSTPSRYGLLKVSPQWPARVYGAVLYALSAYRSRSESHHPNRGK